MNTPRVPLDYAARGACVGREAEEGFGRCGKALHVLKVLALRRFRAARGTKAPNLS